MINKRIFIPATGMLIVILLGLTLGITPSRGQTLDELITDTLERAVDRYLNEADGEGDFFWGKFSPSGRWANLALDPTNACTGPTLEAWGDDPWGSGEQVVLFRASIYTCPLEKQAQALFNNWVSSHDSRGSIDFHGLPNQVIYYVKDIDFVMQSEMTGLLWTNGNLVFAAEPMTAYIFEFNDVVRSSGTISLEEYIYQEAEKNGLTSTSGSGQPPAKPASPQTDQDQDGFPDAQDSCKNQAAQESRDGCPPFEVTAQCGPAEPQEGDTVTCMAQAYGVPDGNDVDYQWFLNMVANCVDAACAWQAQQGNNQVSVSASAKPSGKSASASLSIPIGGAASKVKDDPLAGFIITYLGCSNEITSDDVMECAVGFQRQNEEIKGLVVTWVVNGSRAAVETRTDDGSFYNLSQPAPGVHTIEVQVTDPNTGRSRVTTTTARIYPGQNASIPPGAGAAAGAGTATLIGVWLWSQWWLAKKRGGAPAGSPISRLPAAPTKDEIYSGEEARKKLKELNIWGDLSSMEHGDLRNPDYLVRRDELLDTRFDQRKVKSISYKTKTIDGKEVIDEGTIVIILEEPEKAPPPPQTPSQPDEPPPSPEETKPPDPEGDKPPDKTPPKSKKPPDTPPVDPKEKKMREEVKKWEDEAKKNKQEMDGFKKNHAAVADKVRELGARFNVENKTQLTDGVIEAMDTILMVAKDMATLGQADEIEKFVYEKFQKEVSDAYKKDFIKNLIKTLMAKSHAADQSLEPGEMINMVKDPLGVKRVPGGAMKESLIQIVKRIPVVGKFIAKPYDYFEQTYAATKEYRQHSENLNSLLKQKKGFFERQLELETRIHDRKVDYDWAQKKQKEAQEALAAYLKNKAKPPSRLPR